MMLFSPQFPNHCRRRRRNITSGFTLLEVLLAAALSTILMLGVWSLFSTYGQLFETGQAKTEQSQLARALMQQFNDDLHSAIQDTTARPRLKSPGGSQTDEGAGAGSSSSTQSVPVRRFGLFGSRSELRFDVLQVTPLQAPQTPDEYSETPARGTIGRVPELRTVRYWFQKPRDSEDMEDLKDPEVPAEDDRQPRPGLLRCELDFETPDMDENRPKDSGQPSRPDTDRTDLSEDNEDESPLLDDERLTWVPEVVALEFRYFDGSAWRSSWNSLDQKSLPVAVEILMRVKSYERRVRRQTAAESEEDFAGLVEEDLGERDEEALTQSYCEDYRLVVDLPAAPLNRGVRRVAPSTAQQRVARPAPRRLRQHRLAPPRNIRTIPKSKDRSLPDRWLRTNSR